MSIGAGYGRAGSVAKAIFGFWLLFAGACAAPAGAALAGAPAGTTIAGAPAGTTIAGAPAGTTIAGASAGTTIAGAPAGTTMAGAPVRLLVLGDSLTAGYGLAAADGFQSRLAAALAARGLAVRLVDAAVSGDTAAGGRARLDWTLAASPADAAIVALGANDGLRGSDPKQMEHNLAAILDALAARNVPVLLSGMYPPPNMGAAYTAEFRAVFDRLGSRAGVIYDPFLLEGVAGQPALNQPDGIHPNAEGVRREVSRLLPAVEQLVRRAR